MPLTTDTLQYAPAELWQPPKIGEDLSGFVDEYLIDDGRRRSYLEHKIAGLLVAEQQDQFNIYSTSIYRAQKATELRKGNCYAEAETIIAIGEQLGIDMYLHWTTRPRMHASTLWAGKNQVWSLDHNGGKVWGEIEDNEIPDKTTSEHQRTARLLLDQTGGRAFINLSGAKSSDVDFAAIEGELGDNKSPFESFAILLPGEEGVRFLAAMGDRQRYQQTQQDLWQAVGSQVLRFIPQGC